MWVCVCVCHVLVSFQSVVQVEVPKEPEEEDVQFELVCIYVGQCAHVPEVIVCVCVCVCVVCVCVYDWCMYANLVSVFLHQCH